MAFDSTRIISQMNIKGSLPEGRFSDQELLDFAYDSLLSEIVPVVLSTREDYLVTYDDIAIVANQNKYPIPTRALNGIIREIKILNSSTLSNPTRKDIEDIRTTSTGSSCDIYLEGNNIVLYKTPAASTGSIRVWYFLRPSRLVPVSETAEITAIDTGTNTITITIPTGWTSSDTFDLIKGKAHFDIVGKDLTASSVAGGSITFDDALPDTLAVGDYVALAEETCFPLLPPEGHVALVQAAVTAALESMGDPTSANSAGKTQALLAAFKSVLATRIQGEAKALGKRLI